MKILSRPHPCDLNGTQDIYRFANGYGASVIQNNFSHGGMDGLYELAVLVFVGKEADDFLITYDTPITDDVVGYLSESDVTDYLDRIAALPPRPEPES